MTKLRAAMLYLALGAFGVALVAAGVAILFTVPID